MRHTAKVQAHGEQPFSGSDWVYSRKVFNEATSATQLARVMYSFLLLFFLLGFWGEFLARHTHDIQLAKGECYESKSKLQYMNKETLMVAN